MDFLNFKSLSIIETIKTLWMYEPLLLFFLSLLCFYVVLLFFLVIYLLRLARAVRYQNYYLNYLLHEDPSTGIAQELSEDDIPNATLQNENVLKKIEEDTNPNSDPDLQQLERSVNDKQALLFAENEHLLSNSIEKVHSYKKDSDILVHDDRRLYMREHYYRTLQMALRNAKEYKQACMINPFPDNQVRDRRYDLFLEDTFIGNGRWAHIPARGTNTSPVHAKVKKFQNKYVLYDMLSNYGVYLNGSRILRPHALTDGDEIRIGSTTFYFEATLEI